MSHDKSLIDRVLDLALFGPLGLVMAANEALPDWVDKGRRQVMHRVGVAQMVGEHATRHGQKVVTGTLVGLGILPGAPPPPLPRPPVVGPVADPDPDRQDFRPPATQGSTNGRPQVAPVAEPGNGGSVPGRPDLAIPGYDSLSASHVVQRLAGLAPPELEAVRAYEAAGRGRRTILTKISQLQSGRS